MDYSQSQRLATIFSICVLFITLCSGSALASYIYGQDKGYHAGCEAGQQAGYSQGYNQGKDEGYQAGYKTGRESGLLEATTGYNLRNPTYQEMKEFLAQDTTDSKTYIKDEYNCNDFSAQVNNNAEAQGIRCAIVATFYPEGYGHTIVAFETADKGLIFIEPQFDHEVNLIIGESYSQTNNFTPAPPDDTIKRFLVIW